MKNYSKNRSNDVHGAHESSIKKKKVFGQHFLRKQSTLANIVNAAGIRPEHTILEIGCGDGALTYALLTQSPCKKILVYEIDKEWAKYTGEKLAGPRLSVTLGDILDADFSTFTQHNPLLLVANLPYQITFPLFQKLAANRELFENIIVMIQEEVAQKLVAKRGKPYSAMTLFLQHYFDFTLLEKVEPTAFVPAPKIFSRVIEAKPKATLVAIHNEEKFWEFVRACFKFPRQTLKNNMKHCDYSIELFPEAFHTLRAQQLTFEQLHEIWLTIESPQ